MRQIKFRVWDSKEIEMVSDPQATEILLRHNMGFYDKPDSAYKPSELEVMQYTGLKDKNGKEIYEGDVVKLSYPLYKDDIDKIQEVCWDDYTYSLRRNRKPDHIADFPTRDDGKIYSDLDTTTIATVEIIGNIHENPELL